MVVYLEDVGSEGGVGQLEDVAGPHQVEPGLVLVHRVQNSLNIFLDEKLCFKIGYKSIHLSNHQNELQWCSKRSFTTFAIIRGAYSGFRLRGREVGGGGVNPILSKFGIFGRFFLIYPIFSNSVEFEKIAFFPPPSPPEKIYS